MNTINRILINTISQYIKIILGAVLMLYATRIVLFELGETDYGLYSLLGSVIVFLSFIGTTLSRSTQRFLSYHAGMNDTELLRKVFFNSIILHFGASIIISIIILICENFFFHSIFSIIPDKIAVAKILYRLLIIGVFITINTAPFIAVFIAHENIVFTSILHIGSYVLKLIVAFSLSLFSDQNRLEIYGWLMVGISAIEMIFYISAGYLKYPECSKFIKYSYYSPKLLKDFLSFSWWNMYGTICVLSRQQGYAMALNHFFGLLYNSGYGIATQISTQINSLVYSLSNAVSPIITKSEGGNNRERMIYGSIESSKISLLLFISLVIPFLFFGNPLFQVWLKDVPSATYLFTSMIILSTTMDSFSSSLRTGIFAIGIIKEYSLKVYSIKVFSIIVSIIIFYFKGNLFISLCPYVIFELWGSLMTIKIFCKLTNITQKYVIQRILGKCIIPMIATIIICLIIYLLSSHITFTTSVVGFVCSFITVIVIAYYFSLDKKERGYVDSLLKLIQTKLISHSNKGNN